MSHCEEEVQDLFAELLPLLARFRAWVLCVFLYKAEDGLIRKEVPDGQRGAVLELVAGMLLPNLGVAVALGR